MWSAVERTSFALTSVVLMRPWRISSVVSARIRALRWSAGRLSFFSLLPWRIICTSAGTRLLLQAGAAASGREASVGARKPEAAPRKATRRSARMV